VFQKREFFGLGVIQQDHNTALDGAEFVNLCANGIFRSLKTFIGGFRLRTGIPMPNQLSLEPKLV
jgi:hypothetical protein